MTVSELQGKDSNCDLHRSAKAEMANREAHCEDMDSLNPDAKGRHNQFRAESFFPLGAEQTPTRLTSSKLRSRS